LGYLPISWVVEAMHKWYVVQVLSSQEKKVKKALEEHRESKGMAELVVDVLVPTENVAEVKRGEQKVSEKRMWPGYILVKMNLTDDSWMYVKNTNGVIDFLGGAKPTPLLDQEVEEILTDIEEKKKGVVQKHNITIGDKVKITDGVFVNFIGTVIEVFHEKGRISVMVSIFGRETRVDDLEFWQVEQVPAETEVG
jgi:transcriptional antiterminator NusG